MAHISDLTRPVPELCELCRATYTSWDKHKRTFRHIATRWLERIAYF